MENNSFMFENLHPTKLFMKCAVPAALSMIFSGLYSIADGIFVGRCIGSDALAAVNLVSADRHFLCPCRADRSRFFCSAGYLFRAKGTRNGQTPYIQRMYQSNFRHLRFHRSCVFLSRKTDVGADGSGRNCSAV